MCFKNLPIEFDAQGRAHLRQGVANPYAYQANGHPLERQERVRELLARNGHIKEVSIDPVTRVAGALAFHSVVDLENRTVHDAHSMATLFRGYEIILKGRDPRDAIFISSRRAACAAESTRTAPPKPSRWRLALPRCRWAPSCGTSGRPPNSCTTTSGCASQTILPGPSFSTYVCSAAAVAR